MLLLAVKDTFSNRQPCDLESVMLPIVVSFGVELRLCSLGKHKNKSKIRTGVIRLLFGDIPSTIGRTIFCSQTKNICVLRNNQQNRAKVAPASPSGDVKSANKDWY